MFYKIDSLTARRSCLTYATSISILGELYLRLGESSLCGVGVYAIGGLVIPTFFYIEVWSLRRFILRSKELLMLLRRVTLSWESFKATSRFLLLICSSKAELLFNTFFDSLESLSIDVANDTYFAERCPGGV